MRRALIATGAATLLGAVALLSVAPAAFADLTDSPPPAPRKVAPAASSATPSAAPPPVAVAPSVDEGLVVARVGNATITAAELDRRLSQTAPFQLKPFGDSAEAIRRGFLEQVMVKELLVAREAEERKLAERPELADRVRGVYRAALVSEVKRELGQTAVTDDEVKAYYASNLEKFVAPPKVALYRILVATEAEAKAVIAELGEAPDAKKFAQIARDKSLDKETAMRGGNLGFVAPNGETGQRGQKVDPVLVKETQSVKDGALAPPIKEGGRWAVVWKRQTLRAVTRTLEAERAGIRQLLAQERMQSTMEKLLTGLRADVEQHPEMVDVLTIDSAGDLSRAIRPGTLPRSKRGARPQPEPSPIGPR